jgi:hypothetical protein
MDRIDDPTAETDKNGPGKDGFTEGDGGLVLPTRLREPWLNAVQEEIVSFIERENLTPNPADTSQLSQAARNDGAEYVVETSGSSSPNALEFTEIRKSLGSSYTINSDVELEPGRRGIYQVTLHVRVLSDDTTNPINFFAAVETNGGASDEIFRMHGIRYSATNTVHTVISGTCNVYIEDENSFITVDLHADFGNVTTPTGGPSGSPPEYFGWLTITRLYGLPG